MTRPSTFYLNPNQSGYLPHLSPSLKVSLSYIVLRNPFPVSECQNPSLSWYAPIPARSRQTKDRSKERAWMAQSFMTLAKKGAAVVTSFFTYDLQSFKEDRGDDLEVYIRKEPLRRLPAHLPSKHRRPKEQGVPGPWTVRPPHSELR